MAKIVHARLDDETALLLEKLRLQTGANESTLVRDGIRALGRTLPDITRAMPIGVAAFESGTEDLASNKAHLDGFGR